MSEMAISVGKNLAALVSHFSLYVVFSAGRGIRAGKCGVSSLMQYYYGTTFYVDTSVPRKVYP